MRPVHPAAPRSNIEAWDVTLLPPLLEQRKTICPAGVESTQCSRLDGEKASGVQYRFEWNQGLCRECPMKERCLGPGEHGELFHGGGMQHQAMDPTCRVGGDKGRA